MQQSKVLDKADVQLPRDLQWLNTVTSTGWRNASPQRPSFASLALLTDSHPGINLRAPEESVISLALCLQPAEKQLLVWTLSNV